MSFSDVQKTASGREPMIVREQRAWRMFVESLVFAPHRISKEHMVAVLRHWDFLKARFCMGEQVLYTPMTTVPDEHVSLTWDAKTRVFNLEVAPDGKIDWFYRNRSSREIAGTEEAVEEIPEEAVKRLRSVLQVYKRSDS